MADNYLERAMDDLRSGRLKTDTRNLAASVAHKRAPRGRLAGKAYVIIGNADGKGVLKGAELKRQGASVDFIDSDFMTGQQAAQKYSFKFWPADIENSQSIQKRIEEIRILRKTKPEIIWISGNNSQSLP